MEPLVEQGFHGHYVAGFPCKERLRSSSCGVHLRSMSRQQRSCGDLHGRARSTGRLRRLSNLCRPPQEVQLRPESSETDRVSQKELPIESLSGEAAGTGQSAVVCEEDLVVS